MEEMNLDVAGGTRHGRDAHPHQVKMLLPRPETAGIGKPRIRATLVRRLLEHQKFKAAPNCSTSANNCVGPVAEADERWRPRR
jgi:hypothetical protein